MAQTDQDIEIWEGEYIEIPFGVVDTDGAVVNISGATLAWKMCVDGPTGEVMLTKTPSIVSGAGGTCKVTIAAGDTTTMGGKSYYHELAITLASRPEVGATGKIKINKSANL